MNNTEHATTAALLGASWEKGDGSMDGAMLVDGEWWHPIMGCDSLQETVDHIRARFGGGEVK